MGDDLDSFFAKKKAKAGKKKLIQDVQVLAEKLEQTVKEQEEIDKQQDGNEDRENHQKQQEQTQYQQPNSPDDSEWIEYKEEKIDLHRLNIKDFDATDPDPSVPDEEEVSLEPRRTWNVDKGDKEAKRGSDDEEEDEETESGKDGSEPKTSSDKPAGTGGGDNAPDGGDAKPSTDGDDKPSEPPAVVDAAKAMESKMADVAPNVYRPPHRTSGSSAAGASERRAPAWKVAAPNLTDDMQFPSLADADSLAAIAESEAEAEKKRKILQPGVQEKGGKMRVMENGEGSWSRGRKFDISFPSGPAESQPMAAPAAAPEPEPPVNPNAYVPPSRRRQAQVVTAPQPQTTTQNRWANLNDVDSKQ